MSEREKKSIYRTLRTAVQGAVERRQSGEKLDIQSAVRRIRLEKKLSGVELCRRAGDLDPRTLTAIEKGRIKNPTIKTLQSLARGLGVTVSDLFRSVEMEFEQNYCVGTPKGAFLLDFSKKGLKIVSFTPLIRDFFCGKLILGPKVKITDTLMDHPFPIFISVLVGSLEITVDNQTTLLKEGDNIFFHGVLEHTFANPLHRETSLLMLMAPSFLK